MASSNNQKNLGLSKDMGQALAEVASALDSVMDQKITQKSVAMCIVANFLSLCPEDQIDVICKGNSELGERAKQRLAEGHVTSETKRILQKYRQARGGKVGSGRAKHA